MLYIKAKIVVGSCYASLDSEKSGDMHHVSPLTALYSCKERKVKSLLLGDIDGTGLVIHPFFGREGRRKILSNFLSSGPRTGDA